MVARAILHTRGTLPEAFFRPAQDLAAATLMISDAVARKAALGRGTDPAPQPNSNAVGHEALARLRSAVSFTTPDLAGWLNPLPIESLQPLVRDLPAPYDDTIPPIAALHRPIVRDGDRFIVAAPHFLLPALLHALLALARQHDQLEVVADRFHDAVYGNVLLSARYFDWDEIDGELPALGTLRARESVFVLDRDKLAHVLVLVDDLAAFGGDPFSGWDAQANAPAVETRLDEVRDHLLGLPQQPDQVLQLVVIQGLDRPNVFALEDGSEHAPRLVLTAADLETLGLLEGGRRLLLWKYARARWRFLERTQAVGGGELDLFHLFRENDDSFYLFDEALPDVGFVLPEGVGELRREVQRTRDLHGMRYINGALVEVMLTQQQREIPIYMPMPPPPGDPRALLAVLPTDVVNAADRRSVPERAVRSAPVVVLEPVWQGSVAMSM